MHFRLKPTKLRCLGAQRGDWLYQKLNREREMIGRMVALVAFVLLCAAVRPALAGPIEDAREAYRKGDYVTALSLSRPLAEGGNAPAQNLIGVDAQHRPGRAARRRHGAILVPQGCRTRTGQGPKQPRRHVQQRGEGVPQDDATALSWYRKAAEQERRRPVQPRLQ